MKFVADINIAQSVIYFLRDLKHEVLDAKNGYLLAKDTEIVKLAQKENGIILTRDKDFEELVATPKYRVAVIIFRLRDQKPENIIKYLKKVLAAQKDEIISQSLVIITEESMSVKSIK